MPEPAVLPAFKSEPWIASLLFRAVADGRWEDAVSALRGGADPHFPNTSGFNLFHHCALARDGQSAARVLDALPPAQIRGLAALWPSKTPLMLAARSDSPEVALWLLRHGAARLPEDAPRALALAQERGCARAALAILSFMESEALGSALGSALGEASESGSRGRL